MHVVFRNCTRNEVNVAIAPSRIRGQQLECEGMEADYPLKLLYLNSVHSRALLEHRDFGRSPGHFNQFNPIILFCLPEITTTIQPRSPLFCRSVDSWISQTRGRLRDRPSHIGGAVVDFGTFYILRESFSLFPPEG